MIDSHTHTRYSKHAIGSVDELVQEALNKQVKVLTITDHAPFYEDETNRLLEAELQNYLEEVERAKQKYAESIKILKGLECDYMPGSYDYLVRLLDNVELDYVIGSIHYIPVNGGLVKVWDLPRLNDPGVIKNYFSCLEELITCELFDAVGHADSVLRSIPDTVFFERFHPMVPLLNRHCLSYELNASGLRKTSFDPISRQETRGAWSYPSKAVLTALLQEGTSCTIGSDAHAPFDVGAGIQDLLAALVPVGLRTVSYYENRKRIDVPVHDVLFHT